MTDGPSPEQVSRLKIRQASIGDGMATAVDEASAYLPLVSPETSLIDLGRSLIGAGGDTILAAPNLKLISALHRADNRIDYFGYSIPPEYKDYMDSDGHFKLADLPQPEYDYGQLVGTPLAKQIAEDFPEKPFISARGISCSINGFISDGGLFVRDIRHIVNIGDEQGKIHTNVGSIYRDKEGHPELHYRVLHALIGGNIWFRDHFPKEVAKGIFPALLLYDDSKLTSSGDYDVSLPQDPMERATAIVKAYILPRPKSRR